MARRTILKKILSQKRSPKRALCNALAIQRLDTISSLAGSKAIPSPKEEWSVPSAETFKRFTFLSLKERNLTAMFRGHLLFVSFK